MKKKKAKIRNAHAVAAKTRKGGRVKNKSDKRKNGKNKFKEYLNENY